MWHSTVQTIVMDPMQSELRDQRLMNSSMRNACFKPNCVMIRFRLLHIHATTAPPTSTFPLALHTTILPSADTSTTPTHAQSTMDVHSHETQPLSALHNPLHSTYPLKAPFRWLLLSSMISQSPA